MKALLLTTALLSVGAAAAPMEVITVIYRTPVDYALYQQKAEIHGYFQAELNAAIRDDARSQMDNMRSDFGDTKPLAAVTLQRQSLAIESISAPN